MRTTITLDEDVARAVERLRREQNISFKEAINSTLRKGLDRPTRGRRRFRLKTHPMGLRPGLDLTKATQLAAQLEDEEIARKLRLGK